MKMDENEKAFIIASIDLKLERDREFANNRG